MTSLLDVMDHLISAQLSRAARRPALQQANVGLERARLPRAPMSLNLHGTRAILGIGQHSDKRLLPGNRPWNDN